MRTNDTQAATGRASSFQKTHTHKLDNTAKAHLTATFMGAGRASSAPAAAIATQVATDPRTTGAAKAA